MNHCVVLVLTLLEDTILKYDLSTGDYRQTMFKSSFLYSIILQEYNFRMKKKKMQFLPRVFSYHISSSTKHFVKVREKEKQYNPTHLKYGYKNSFPRLLLSPYNRDTQLHPIEIDYIHSSPHLPFYLDFLHNTDKKTPRDTKILLTTDTNLDMQIHLRCGHYNH